MAAREYYTSYAASEVTNTSSSTWTDASSLTFTATSSQDYIIFWSMELANKTNTTADAEFRVNVDGTQVVYHNVESRNTAEYAAYSGFFKITGAGVSTTITPQIQPETNGNTIAIRNIRLTALALGPNDQYAESLGRTAITAGGYWNYSTLTTINFTPSVTSAWLMLGSSGVDNFATTAPAYGAFSLDSQYVEWPVSVAENGAGVQNVVPLFAAYITDGEKPSGTPISASWQGRALNSGNNSGWTDNRILMLCLNDFENYGDAFPADDVTTTSATPIEAFSFTGTLSGNPHLLFATVSNAGNLSTLTGTTTVDDSLGNVMTSVRRVYNTNEDRGFTNSVIAVREYTPGTVNISVNIASNGTNEFRSKWVSNLFVLDLGTEDSGGTDVTANLS